MIEVRINDSSPASFEKGMKIFKKKCQNDGFMMELRERRYFKKPSVKRHEVKQEILRQQKRNKRRK